MPTPKRTGKASAAAAAGFSQDTKARIFLCLACLWPLWVVVLFGASSSSSNVLMRGTTLSSSSSDLHSVVANSVNGAVSTTTSSLNRYSLRNALDRVDIMGYGPTHPRVAFVVVGNDPMTLKTTVESIFRQTDLNRIFLICAVLDGNTDETAAQLERELLQMDQGSVPHWHGLRLDIHKQHGSTTTNNNNNNNEEEPHGHKIHLMVHNQPLGVAAARWEAVEFIQLLEQKHMQAGLKSPEEDFILVLLSGGAQLAESKWLQAVTNALIVPPPLLLRNGGGINNNNNNNNIEDAVALKLANAVSFPWDTTTPGMVTTFDEKLQPFQVPAKTSDINLSSGESYSTPTFDATGGMAMRLQTFVDLPAQDKSLVESWNANLDLSLNLWLCADGIDIVQGTEITTTTKTIPPPPPSSDADMAARLAAVWMDRSLQSKFLQAYASSSSSSMTRLDWETKMQSARQSPHFPKGDMTRKCRSFEWYIREINQHWANVLEQPGWGKTTTATTPSEHGDKKTVTGAAVGNTSSVVTKEEIAIVTEKKENDANVNQDNEQHAAKEDSPIHQDVANKDEHSVEIPHEEHHEPPPEKNEPDVPPPPEAQRQEKEQQHEVVERPKPKVPLRKENLEIVQIAKPMDISYKPVHGGHLEHPHMGAKDENGNWGYVHDEKALRNNPPPITWEDRQLEQACRTRDNNFKMMTQRVFVDKEYDTKQQESGVKRDKIFCLVYTIESGHPRIPFIRETWGPKCDGFMVGSTKTDKSLGTVEIPHEGPEEYNNIWQKVRSMWSYIYDNYYEEYDWFHIGGDDLFLIIENLRYYLESEEIRTAANGGIYLPTGNETMQTPLLLGRRFAYQGDMNDIFDSGGSGYTMNKAAFKLLVTEGFPNYFPHAHTFSEDTMVAKLFRKMSVLPYDTKDDDGGERYMPFLPGHHWGYRLTPGDWYTTYSINIKEGPEHCSPRSVAFHYVKDKMMKRLFALAYGLCPAEYMTE